MIVCSLCLAGVLTAPSGWGAGLPLLHVQCTSGHPSNPMYMGPREYRGNFWEIQQTLFIQVSVIPHFSFIFFVLFLLYILLLHMLWTIHYYYFCFRQLFFRALKIGIKKALFFFFKYIFCFHLFFRCVCSFQFLYDMIFFYLWNFFWPYFKSWSSDNAFFLSFFFFFFFWENTCHSFWKTFFLLSITNW